MPILTHSFQGLPGGMNQDAPIHEMPDTQARWMQDILLDVPGVVRRRGPIAALSSYAVSPTSHTPSGIAITQDPTGAYKIAMFGTDFGETVTQAQFWNGSSWTSYNFNASQLPATSKLAPVNSYGINRAYVKASPALGGGSWIALANAAGVDAVVPGNKAANFLWRGCITGDTSTTLTSAILCDYTGQSSSFTVSGGNPQPGHFVWADSGFQTLIGVVQTGGATVTLDAPALFPLTNGSTVYFTPFREAQPRMSAGRISTTTASTAVTGTQGPLGTKFRAQLGTLTPTGARIFRASTGEFVGLIASVTDNSAVVLTANAAQGLTNEAYFIPNQSGVASGASTTIGLGYITAQYNGRQWFASVVADGQKDYQARLWFSDLGFGEQVDITSTGSWFAIQSAGQSITPIQALAPLPNGLAIFKDSELWLLRGNDVTNFTITKIADIGTICGTSVVPYKNGVLFAAREGLYFYDGTRLQIIAPHLGTWWYDGLSATSLPFRAGYSRASGFVYRDHYIVTVDNFTSPTQYQKGSVSITPGDSNSTMTVVTDLDTGSSTILTNAYFLAGYDPPRQMNIAPFMLVRSGAGLARMCSLQTLFTTQGIDSITTRATLANTLGPNFYLETKRYDLGDPERKKLFKQIAMQYVLTGNTLQMDTVPGLQNVGTPTVQPWLTQTDWFNARKKFTKRSTHIGFRIYQTDAAVASIQIGPWALGYKLQRPGRV